MVSSTENNLNLSDIVLVIDLFNNFASNGSNLLN